MLIMMSLCMYPTIFDEVDQIHPSAHSFRKGFATVLPNLLKLAEGKSLLAKPYTDARQDAPAEDVLVKVTLLSR